MKTNKNMSLTNRAFMAGLISRVAISSKETILNLNLWSLNRKQIKGCIGIAGLDSSDDLF